jgi:hypothetical protein
MPVRQDNEIKRFEVNALCLHIGCKYVGVIAGVEQDSFSGDLYEGREAPVFRHRRIGSECIVENSDLTFGLGRGGCDRAGHRDEA